MEFTGHIEGLTELQGPTVFTYNDLKSATGDFNDKNKLGQGGFSTVYKVTFDCFVFYFLKHANFIIQLSLIFSYLALGGAGKWQNCCS